MAIDTRNKRASCISLASHTRPAFPHPDGSLTNAADRQHMALTYPGILAVSDTILPMINANTLIVGTGGAL